MTSRLTNAPLFYVLVQVQFNQLMQLEKYVPEIQDNLRRAGFPDFDVEEQNVVQFHQGDGQPPKIDNSSSKRWLFMDMDRTHGFILTNSTITYHTTNYESSNALLENVSLGLNHLHDSVGLDFFSRIGLRFLDAVIAEGDECLAYYVHPSLLGAGETNISKPLMHTFSESAFQYDEGILVSKVFRTKLNSQPIPLPRELTPLLLSSKEKFSSVTGDVLVLDTDHIHMPSQREKFEVSKVLSVMRTLKKNMQDAFECMVTAEALKTWR